MSDIAIRVNNLGKLYHIGGTQARYKTIRESIVDGVRAPFRRAGRLVRGQAHGAAELDQTIWALKNVSFDVRQGEVIGIIGRNGAGKSTLLKVLSSITEPSEGEVAIRGRVGSLLEVGTGFHPELTGRDNIYLNGAILGMRRAEIDRKFDEIVAFSEVEKFIDTPVKHYSSGMYVRLAFSVAAHMEPDILLVDEVLSVGDTAFQRKCLGKMEDVAHRGRTVLFVSHQLAMINTLCETAHLLSNGHLEMSGPTAEVIDHYLQSVTSDDSDGIKADFAPDPELSGQLLQTSLVSSDAGSVGSYDVFDPVTLHLKYVIREPLEGTGVNLVVRRNGEILFVSFDTDDEPQLLDKREPGVYETSVDLPCPLKAGHYTIDLSLGKLNVGGIDVRPSALSFEIVELSFDTSKRSYSLKRPGVLAAHLGWRTERTIAAPELSGD